MANLKGKQMKQQMKNQKCHCCKQIGNHTIENCDKDPNLKTTERNAGEEIKKDFKRIKALKDDKKVFADTIVQTSTFLKRCVRVKKLIPKDSDYSPKGSLEKFERKHQQNKRQNKKDVFLRGAMMFDDYNYSQHNKYVLKDGKMDDDEESDLMDNNSEKKS